MTPTQIQLFDTTKRAPSSFVIPKGGNNSKTIIVKKLAIKELSNNKETLESALNSIFLGSKEENRLLQARTILGNAIKNMPDEELKTYITEFQSLVDTWLDGFEKQLFDNKTLKQLLKEA